MVLAPDIAKLIEAKVLAVVLLNQDLMLTRARPLALIVTVT